MPESTSSQLSFDRAAAAGWSGLALGVLVVVLYGLSMATGGSWLDPLGLKATESTPAADPARFQQALEEALDQAWTQLGGHAGGMVFEELTRDPQRLRRAGQLIDGVLASSPDRPRAHLLQGLWHAAADRDEAAVQSVQRSLDLGGGHQSLLVLGTLHTHLGRLDAAEAVFRRAVEQVPGSVAAWNNLGQVLWQLGRQDEAEAAYRRKLELAEPAVAAESTAVPPTSAQTPATADGDR